MGFFFIIIHLFFVLFRVAAYVPSIVLYKYRSYSWDGDLNYNMHGRYGFWSAVRSFVHPDSSGRYLVDKSYFEIAETLLFQNSYIFSHIILGTNGPLFILPKDKWFLLEAIWISKWSSWVLISWRRPQNDGTYCHHAWQSATNVYPCCSAEIYF